jgi:hypothetical protein
VISPLSPPFIIHYCSGECKKQTNRVRARAEARWYLAAANVSQLSAAPAVPRRTLGFLPLPKLSFHLHSIIVNHLGCGATVTVERHSYIAVGLRCNPNDEAGWPSFAAWRNGGKSNVELTNPTLTVRSAAGLLSPSSVGIKPGGSYLLTLYENSWWHLPTSRQKKLLGGTVPL